MFFKLFLIICYYFNFVIFKETLGLNLVSIGFVCLDYLFVFSVHLKSNFRIVDLRIGCYVLGQVDKCCNGDSVGISSYIVKCVKDSG